MIIKKKYTNVKKYQEPQNDIVSEDFEAISIQDAVISDVNKNNSSIETSVEEKVSEEVVVIENDFNTEDTIVEVNASEEKTNSTSTITDFANMDLALDDVKIEQRQERREGSRRRGYRRTQDRNIVSRAQKEALSIKEQAKQDGYKEGILLATKDIEDLKSKFSEFYNYKEEVYTKVSNCILDISTEIAKKILSSQVEKNSDYLIPLIRKAVEEVNKTENKITLKVMPKDVDLVKDKIPEIFSDDSFEAKISVIGDSSISAGGVIVVTSNGLIDASIETQLAIIEKAFKTNSDSES